MADVLIRGMNIPKGCGVCPLNTGACYCAGLKRYVVEEEHVWMGSNYRRLKDCPLHELPEHGDLIDLDERLTGIIYDEHNNDTDMVTMTAREWLGSVDDIPTVIVPSNKEESE